MLLIAMTTRQHENAEGFFLVITHNVHGSTALSDTVCVDDVHNPAQDPRV